MTPLTTWLVLGAVAVVIAYAVKEMCDAVSDRINYVVADTEDAIAVGNDTPLYDQAVNANPAYRELLLAAEVEAWLKNGAH